MLNKIQLIGNTGDDIKVTNFEGGGCVGRLPFATTEKYTNKQGEKISNVEWHNLIFKNKPAQTIQQYAPKGSKLYIEGRLKYRKWQDEQGNDRYSTEIHVSYFEFISNNPKPNNSSSVETNGDEDDDFPF